MVKWAPRDRARLDPIPADPHRYGGCMPSARPVRAIAAWAVVTGRVRRRRLCFRGFNIPLAAALSDMQKAQVLLVQHNKIEALKKAQRADSGERRAGLSRGGRHVG
jgi:hypothetical protein